MSTMPACIDCKQEMVQFERYGQEAFRCPHCDGEDKGFWDNVFRNENGVLVQLFVCDHWVDRNGNRSWTYIPEVCWKCPNLDGPENGEYGSILSPPYCMKNVWLPTKSNKCKVKDKVK